MTPGSRRTTAATTEATPDRRSTASAIPAALASALVPALVVVLAALPVLLVVIMPTGASAQATEESAAPTGPSVEIVGQTTFVPSDGTFTADLAIEPGPGGPAGLVVSVTLFGLLDDPDGVGKDDAFAQPLNRRAAVALTDLPSTGDGRYRLDMPIRPGPGFDGLDRTLVPFEGVYPLSIELRTAEGPVASDRTYLVRLPTAAPDQQPPSAPGLAVVLAVGGDDLTVARATELAATHPDLPLTVMLSADGLSTLRADGAAASALADALAGRTVVAGPTLDLDPSALAEIDHGHLYHQTLRGLETELTAMGLRTDPTVAVLDAPLTETGIDVMTTAGITRVIDPGSGPGQAGAGQAGGGRLTVVGFDPDATDVLSRHGPAAALGMLSFRTGDDPVTVIGPGVGPDGGGALHGLLASLSEPGAPVIVDPLGPALSSPTVDAAPAGPPEADPSAARPVERPQQDLTPVADLLVDVERLLATYEDFHGGGGTDPAVHRHVILEGLTRDLTPEERRDTLESVRRRLVDDLGVIGLPGGQPVTLAARSATIPVIVESRADGPRKVMLRFRSDKVEAADDGRIVTIEPGTSSIDVELEARSLGASPLSVAIMTPDGQTTLASSQFQIRSTAVPGLGLLVSVGALCCLLAWWVLDARKRRRPGPGIAA